MKKIAILHTTPVTVDLLKNLINIHIPDTTVYNFVDDSILPKLIEANADEKSLNYVFEKMLQYTKYAEDLDVDLIILACSSVGDFIDYAQSKIKTPIMRIDNAMAELSVTMGDNICVVATLGTTLAPSTNIVKKVSMNMNKNITTALLSEAYTLLQQGKREEHNKFIGEALNELIAKNDVIVLAQASMANALEYVPSEWHCKVLTSPELGIKMAKTILGE